MYHPVTWSLIEQDDYDLPEKMRCTRGHFLSKEPTHFEVLSDSEHGILTKQEFDTFSEERKRKCSAEPIWRCLCGAERRDG